MDLIFGAAVGGTGPRLTGATFPVIDALHPQNLKVSVLEMLSELVSALTDDSLTSILKSTVASSMVKAGMGTSSSDH